VACVRKCNLFSNIINMCNLIDLGMVGSNTLSRRLIPRFKQQTTNDVYMWPGNKLDDHSTTSSNEDSKLLYI